MDRIKLKELAKQQISGQLGVFLLIYIAVVVISSILGLIPAVGTLLSFVAGSLFQIQIIIIFLALSRGIFPEFKDLFDIFKNSRLCGNAVIVNILISVFTFLWSLLLIVPGIIKGLSYSMAPYILAENEYYMSPQDAIKESMRIMEGHKMELFVLELSFVGWFLLCSVTCGIAGIYVFPYHQATLANFYNEIKDRPQTNNTIYM
ncbi:MAG: DUF975 family protein [Clostridia bacterium]|nr:DUF975 family protein [Clostridia bacterium]MBP3360079.1 DUF975 family protein [Clostridia bacterium]